MKRERSLLDESATFMLVSYGFQLFRFGSVLLFAENFTLVSFILRLLEHYALKAVRYILIIFNWTFAHNAPTF